MKGEKNENETPFSHRNLSNHQKVDSVATIITVLTKVGKKVMERTVEIDVELHWVLQALKQAKQQVVESPCLKTSATKEIQSTDFTSKLLFKNISSSDLGRVGQRGVNL